MPSLRKPLYTERFILKPLSREHLNLLIELFTDTEVMRYVAAKPYTPMKAAAHAKVIIPYEETRASLGTWAVHDKASTTVHGWVALQKLGADIEVGFRIRRSSWGKGVATEGGSRLVDYCFQDLALEHVVAITWKRNLASQRVIEKIGLRLEKEYELDGVDWCFYRLTAKQWSDMRGSAGVVGQ